MSIMEGPKCSRPLPPQIILPGLSNRGSFGERACAPAGREQNKTYYPHCCCRTPSVRWNYVAKNFAQVRRWGRRVDSWWLRGHFWEWGRGSLGRGSEGGAKVRGGRCWARIQFQSEGAAARDPLKVM